MSKIDRTEIGEIKRVSKETGTAIMKARTMNKLSQKQLAVLINEKQEVIASYESNRAIISQKIIIKLERALRVKLTGKNIG